jgi:hypothetical protein
MPAPILLLLHEGGWDEVLMVAVGLVAAYVVIMWTGRRSQDEDDEGDDVDASDDDSVDADPVTDRPSEIHDELPRPKS